MNGWMDVLRDGWMDGWRDGGREATESYVRHLVLVLLDVVVVLCSR